LRVFELEGFVLRIMLTV